MKKIAAILICIVMLGVLLMGCSKDTPTASDSPGESKASTEGSDEAGTTAKEAGSFKVGITIQSLANSYWGGVFGEVENLLKEKGWEYTIVDCKDNSAEQISQIENFTNSGCDLIMVHPSDPVAIEDVCAQAREAGIKVMSWDDKMTNTDLNWVLDNEELGKAIGTAAADFINEHYTADNKAQVAIMDYPQTPILLDRENGILAGLEETCNDNYEVIAQQPAIEAGAAQSNMETILQANPDCKVVCSIGAGGDVGANEAFMAATGGEIPEDMGIFSADATQEQMQAIMNGEASCASVGFEGSNKKTAEAVLDLYRRLMEGDTFPDQNLVRPLTVINKDNAEEYLKDYK